MDRDNDAYQPPTRRRDRARPLTFAAVVVVAAGIGIAAALIFLKNPVASSADYTPTAGSSAGNGSTGNASTGNASGPPATGACWPASACCLPVMAPPEGAELFAKIVGSYRAAAEPETMAENVAPCAGLPLAIRIAAVRLAARPGWPIAEMPPRARSGCSASSRRRVRPACRRHAARAATGQGGLTASSTSSPRPTITLIFHGLMAAAGGWAGRFLDLVFRGWVRAVPAGDSLAIRWHAPGIAKNAPRRR
jgi:hypothetical protein